MAEALTESKIGFIHFVDDAPRNDGVGRLPVIPDPEQTLQSCRVTLTSRLTAGIWAESLSARNKR